MNISKTGMKVVFIIVLLLIVLPLVLFILIQFAPPAPEDAATPEESAVTGRSDAGNAAAREHRTKREPHTTRQETMTEEIDPAPTPVWEIGAISTDPTRQTKKMTPYAPGEVPGDSGIVVQYAGSPDDMASGPQPLPPDDDPWSGAVLPPMTPEQMRGIGGARRIDPNDPFFQQDIPNPFAN